MDIQIAKMLKRLRKLEKITQSDLAQELNIERGNIAKYEREITYPPLETLLAISKHFNVSLDYLIQGTSNSSTSGNLREKELMADSLMHMSNQLKLEKQLEESEKDNKMLKEMNRAAQDYILRLEKKLEIK